MEWEALMLYQTITYLLFICTVCSAFSGVLKDSYINSLNTTMYNCDIYLCDLGLSQKTK